MKACLHIVLVAALAFLAFLIARIEYYRELALHHQHQADRYAEIIQTRNNLSPILVESAIEIAAQNPDDPRLNHSFRGALYHRKVAKSYQIAATHPWLMVQQLPPAPVSTYED